jgi:hypothetical protein
VTIAAALNCREGLIFAADSQETISGYIKQQRGKIRTILCRGRFSFAVSGAGTTDYIEAAYQRIFDQFPEPANLYKIEQELRNRAQAFFDEHIARWAYFPESERPSVELLIGVAGPDVHGAFHYSGTVLNRVSESHAIGSGILLANSLFAQYHSYNHTLVETASIAAYVLSKVKKQVDTCGGRTDMVALENSGNLAYVDSATIEVLEKDFENAEKQMTRAFTETLKSKPLKLDWLRGPRGQCADFKD